MVDYRSLFHKLRRWLPAIAVVILFLLIVLPLRNCTLDDSFISYRYAAHLSQGQGLVFNTSERVEGYSNLLWVLVLALWHWLGADIEWISKALGVLSGIAIILLSMSLLTRHFQAPKQLTFFLGLYLATHIGLVYYAVSGMETLFYVLQIILFTCLLTEEKPWYAALINITLMMTRPEGVLFIAPLLMYVWMKRPRSGHTLIIPVIPILWLAGLTLWRWLYYQALLPNTFYAKIKTHWGFFEYIIWHLRTFINSVYASFAWDNAVLIFAAFYLLVNLRKKDWIPIAVLACPFFFVWYSGSDWMSFGRFFVPALPLLGVLAYAGLQRLLKNERASQKDSLGVSLWLLLPVLFNLLSYHYGAESLLTGREINPAMHSRPHREIGLYLKEIAQPGDVVVVNEIGAIGYITDLPIIDMIGLTDATIPRLWKSNDVDGYADYIFSREPRFVMINDRQTMTDVTMHPMHQALYDRLRQNPDYQLLKTFALSEYKNLLLFARQ